MSSGTAKATVRTDQLSQSTAFYSYLAHQPLTTDETSAHLSVGEDLNDSSTVDGSVRAEETLRLHAARVQHVRESLQRADDLTKRMTGIFDSFEDRLKSLVEEIDPMHKKTTELKYKHENIKTTLVLMSKYLKMFDLPFDLREAIHQGPGSDIRAYVGKLDEVQNAVDFFQKHSNFRGSDKTIQHLRSIQEEGLERCHDAFCEILKSNSIPIPDLTKVDIIETIPEDVQETLKDLTKCLSRGQDEKWLQAYCEIRSDFLCNTLDKVTPDRMLREEVSQGGRYKKGSHKLISLNGMFLKLLQTERTLAMNLIPHSQCASTYFETITKAIETFIEAADGIVRQKRPEKMFIVLDIIENLEESLASYKNLLKVSGRDYDQGDILRFVVELKNTTKKNIEEYVEEVESHNIKAIPADGGTHAISSNTLNYAKRLLEYQKVVVGLLDGASAASKVLKAYILRVFNALIENLEHKAKQYSSTKTSYIFLLNNFHHISKFVSDSELLSFVGQVKYSCPIAIPFARLFSMQNFSGFTNSDKYFIR
eukprot:TRINITY_DN7205_c0_g1_i2.p1 TRINITY_DN7205_c0_g1~~TRINITY_DN7205_c0_g1_i2.p1  ORF type:complete len:537 (+),score=121.50 TRINITY_DN7205_c0_g1_i2:120-1730(+)